MKCEKHVERAAKFKGGLITRLNRIEGQIRGIKGMVENDIYCDDILNQVASAQAALRSFSKLLLESHMKSCIVNSIEHGETEIVDELLKTMEKLMK
ncbi:MAG: metal-sensing transcriptional repressor [Clostridiales bacterium]|nr:metal-sensing transcriptional repressor [Clostridiales bacterium]